MFVDNIYSMSRSFSRIINYLINLVSKNIAAVHCIYIINVMIQAMTWSERNKKQSSPGKTKMDEFKRQKLYLFCSYI